MNRYIVIPLIALAFLILSGCAASTLSTAEKKGATPLSAEEIFDLVSNNTLHMVASDFDAYIFSSQDGTVSARSLVNSNKDNGKWDINSDNQLCIKFRVWYYGDVNCFSVYQEPASNRYLLFTSNGALAHTMTVSPGNSQNIQVRKTKETEETFLRSNLEREQRSGQSRPAPTAVPEAVSPPPPASTRGPGASSAELRHTVKSMAKECPGCNLEEADLRKADLVAANLKGANLRGADLSRANLRRANLEGSNLSGATFLSTNLPGANLKNSDLTGADFTGSNLIQADFTGAIIDNIILDNTLLEGVKGLK